MNNTLLNILKSREDISDYVFHFTKKANAKDILTQILADGAIKDNSGNGYICFSESPITMLPAMFKIFEQYHDPMYAPYGVGVKKELLYQLGGRPVIYDDLSGIQKLPDDMKWRGVVYKPNEYDYSWLREWRIKTSQVLINEDNAIVIAKDKEELFNLTYDLGDIDFDGDVEDNGSVFFGFAEGRFTRKYKGVSLDEINQANGMSKNELEETLSNQIPGEEEGRSLGNFISNI